MVTTGRRPPTGTRGTARSRSRSVSARRRTRGGGRDDATTATCSASGGTAASATASPAASPAAGRWTRGTEQGHVGVVASLRVYRRGRRCGARDPLYALEVVVHEVGRQRRVSKLLGRLLTLAREKLDELAEHCSLSLVHLTFRSDQVAVGRDRVGLRVPISEDTGQQLLEIRLELGAQKRLRVGESRRLYECVSGKILNVGAGIVVGDRVGGLYVGDAPRVRVDVLGRVVRSAFAVPAREVVAGMASTALRERPDGLRSRGEVQGARVLRPGRRVDCIQIVREDVVLSRRIGSEYGGNGRAVAGERRVETTGRELSPRGDRPGEDAEDHRCREVERRYLLARYRAVEIEHHARGTCHVRQVLVGVARRRRLVRLPGAVPDLGGSEGDLILRELVQPDHR